MQKDSLKVIEPNISTFLKNQAQQNKSSFVNMYVQRERYGRLYIPNC